MIAIEWLSESGVCAADSDIGSDGSGKSAKQKNEKQTKYRRIKYNKNKEKVKQNERKCCYGPYIFIWIVPTENDTFAQWKLGSIPLTPRGSDRIENK